MYSTTVVINSVLIKFAPKTNQLLLNPQIEKFFIPELLQFLMVSFVFVIVKYSNATYIMAIIAMSLLQ